ncbi:MAG TPA: SpoIIE family protein phosphatase [Actinomycetota bacterium]|nr:SpoIIE family protein phosphatase [Actinomycetota bacterium]
MDRTLNVLLIEDNPGDADLLREYLGSGGSQQFALDWVERLSDGVWRLSNARYDVVMVDLTLPDSHGLETFAAVRAHSPSVPVVVLTGLDDENLALRAVQMGAQDYLIKGTVNAQILVRAIRYAVERKRAEEELARTAQAYEKERAVAEMLQRSLLPQDLPRLPGATLAVRYLAGGPDVEIGGDWYDALSIPGGCIGLAIGDVVGKGVPAATVMAQVRNALRAYAVEGHPPAKVVEQTARFVSEVAPNQLATLVYAEFDPEKYTLTYVNAGHPPPIIMSPDGSVGLIAEIGSLPLGVSQDHAYKERTIDLLPGSVLLMYTDGLVERRTSSIDEGLDALLEAIKQGPEDLESLCDFTIYRMKEPGGTYDDIAMLAMRVLPAFEGLLKMTLPADQEVLGPLRRSLTNWLEGAGLSRETAFDVLVAVSEAAANVIEHAYGPAPSKFEIEADRQDEEIVIVVRDFGAWRESRSSDRGRGLKMMEALMDSLEVVKGKGTTVTMRKRLAKPEEEGGL